MEELKKTTKGVKKENFNPLRKEIVNVKMIRSNSAMYNDPQSPLDGGLSETSFITYAIPSKNGTLVSVLTPEEQAFFEEYFHFPEGFMSPAAINNNYWKTYGMGYINRVTLDKTGKKLDLSQARDYIEYKILLANPEYICPSQEDLENKRKLTYKFVMNNDKQVAESVGKKADIKLANYEAYSKYKDDADMIRIILYLIEHKKVSPNTKIELLKDKLTYLMDHRPSDCYQVLGNNLLEQKKAVLIGTEKGLITERNGYYYLKENGQKIAYDYEDSTLNNAANYLADPDNQELYFNIQKRIQ